MNETWGKVKLGNLLTQVTDIVGIEDDTLYRQVTVRMHNRGLVLRQECLGKVIKTKKQFRVRSGQLVYSRIDARNGAMGIVPTELDGAVVSNDFPVFHIDCQRIDPSFLNYYISTETFTSDCLAQSKGTSNRRRLKEEDFLEIEIPLPLLEDQRGIIEKINNVADLVKQAKAQQEAALRDSKAFIPGIYEKIIGREPQKGWIELSYYVSELENGKSPQCEPRPANDDEWGVLKVGAVSFGVFDETENKALPKQMSPQAQYEVKPGDFLMIRANTKELVGACALVKAIRPHLLLSDKVFRFHFHEGRDLDLSFLNHILKSPAVRSQIESMATGTSPTMKNISKAKVLSIKVPLYPLEKQKRIVSEIENFQGKVNSLFELQKKSLVEIEAVLPSLLDRILLKP